MWHVGYRNFIAKTFKKRQKLECNAFHVAEVLSYSGDVKDYSRCSQSIKTISGTLSTYIPGLCFWSPDWVNFQWSLNYYSSRDDSDMLWKLRMAGQTIAYIHSVFNFKWNFYDLMTILGDSQGLLLILCWCLFFVDLKTHIAKDRTRICHMQGKQLDLCAISPAPQVHLLDVLGELVKWEGTNLVF